ncbi:MAG: signal recognition particle protein [Planctomycetaceae bacterium]|jgi:signal recognition particle subunit SRP54|nr:signal recognition particle protein [Planctomycetaceae bacterium]
MFEGITENLGTALSAFRRQGKLTEGNIRDGMREVRQALLEADVNYEVVQDFMKRVTEEAVGERVLKSLRPEEQIVGVVNEALVDFMGPVDHSLNIRRDGVSVIMMCGLQGSGKTTTCGKLARMLKEQGHHPLLVAADLQRPAAVDQLKVIGEQIGVDVYSEPIESSTPIKVCYNAVKQARKKNDHDVVILDTAGRLHVDDELMAELKQIDNKCTPDQALLVCDSMTGQDAVNSAKSFNDELELDGVILTKLDGDTRGGAAISVKAVTGVPIKFIGVGEQLDKLEPFHPDRMAGRILGMGDVLSLVEKAHEQFDADEMEKQQEKMRKGKFTLEDFRDQMKQIKKLGSMKDIMKMIPGMGGMLDQNPDIDAEGDMSRIEGIINGMTPDERNNPELIDRSRRNRIAQGSGVDPSDVNKLLKDFGSMAGVMKNMAGMGMRGRMQMMKQMTDGGLFNEGASIAEQKQRSKRGPQDKLKMREDKKKKRKDARKQRKKNRR